MYNFIREFHNGIGLELFYGILLFTFYFLVMYLLKKPYNELARLGAILGLIATHLQIGLGFILYFISPLGISNFTSEALSHSTSRFYLVFHPLMMIAAAIIITIGYKSSKKSGLSDRTKYLRLFISYGVGMSLIILPWFIRNS